MAAHADLSRIFVDRPILATVLSALILVAGLLAIPNLPVSEYPDVVPPSVLVTATYPGANPKTIAETVASPIEEAVNGVEGMIYMKSTASSDGVMQLTVTFKGGTDIDLAAVQVQNRVAQALPRLPAPVRALGVNTVKASPTLTMVVHVYSPDARYDELYLSNFVSLRIRDEIARLPGVGQAITFGAGVYAMRIWIDPARAAARGLTAGEIVSAIREQNIEVSAGSLGGPPTPEGTSVQIPINASGRLDSPEAFGDIVLKTGRYGGHAPRGRCTHRTGGPVLLDALAARQRGRGGGRHLRGAGGQFGRAVGIGARDHGAPRRVLPARASTGRWSTTPPCSCRSRSARCSLTLLEAVALVVVVVVLFLQTWRASLIPLIAVPVSIIGTFAVLWSLGMSVNVLTLFGLVLAIGIVVDDAIVVVENVERHIEDGMAPRDAAHQAMREVSGPIVAISLVLASVFVPLAFLGGVTGQFYRQFAVTIAASVLISAFNSLTLSPALAAALLRPRNAPPDAVGRFIERVFGRPFAAVQPLLQAQRRALFLRDRQCHRPCPAAAGDLRRAAAASPCCCSARCRAGSSRPRTSCSCSPPCSCPKARRSTAPTRRCAAWASWRWRRPGVASVVALPGLNAVHFINTPNAGVAFIGITPPARARHAGGGDRHPAEHQVQLDPGRHRLRADAAARARAGQRDGHRAVRAGPGQRRLWRAGPADAGAGRCAARHPGIRSGRDVHCLPVEHAAAGRRRWTACGPRSRASASTTCTRRCRCTSVPPT